MTIERKVWRVDKAGSLDRLHMTENILPPPQDHEATIRVHAVGLNFADVFACLGLYSATPKGEFTPGLEFAGTVHAIGSKVNSYQTGDQVMGGIRFGGYSTYLNIDARYLQPLPPGWSFAEGAAFPVQALTAWYALVELGSVRPGQIVLLHSAAGGVGLLALAIMHKLGVRSIAIVGSEQKALFLQEFCGLSRHQIIVRNPRTFAVQLDAALQNAQASGFDLVLDSLAGQYFQAGYRCLNPRGRLIIYGASSMMPSGKSPNRLRLIWQYWQRPRLDPLAMISRNRSVMGFNLIWLWEQQELFREMIARIMGLKLDAPYIGGRFPFERAPEALRFLQSGTSIGKVVLEI